MFEVTVTNSITPASTPVSAAPVRVTDVRRKGNVEVESPTMGVICIRDVFPLDGNSDEDKRATCMVCVRRLLLLLFLLLIQHFIIPLDHLILISFHHHLFFCFISFLHVPSCHYRVEKIKLVRHTHAQLTRSCLFTYTCTEKPFFFFFLRIAATCSV